MVQLDCTRSSRALGYAAIITGELLVSCQVPTDVSEFQYGAAVPEMNVCDVSPLAFYRSFVSSNQPVLIRNACRHWPALKKWNKQYFRYIPSTFFPVPAPNHVSKSALINFAFFRNKLGEKEAFVAVTPNGYADAVTFDPETEKEYFVMPEEKKMKFSQFLDILDNPKE